MDGTFTNKGFQVGGGTAADDMITTSITRVSGNDLGMPTSGTYVGGEEFQVNTFTKTGQYEAEIAALKSGNYVVTWTSGYNGTDDQDGDGFGVFAQMYDSENVPIGSEFQVNTTTADHQIMRSVTALSDGGFAIVWRVQGQISNANGSKRGGEFQIDSNSIDPMLFSKQTSN